MSRQIEVVAYDPSWPQRFSAEADQLRAVFGAEVVAIHHIGSTSVPGLAAKPIIDILLEVADIERVDAHNDAMRALGYDPRGELGLPRRRYFPKTIDGVRLVHVHTWQTGDPEIDRHLAVRDYLRAHPAEADAYGQLKQRVSAEVAGDSERYVAGKDAYVVALQARAVTWTNKEQPA